MYKLSDLPYKYDALEPYISKETVDNHYNLHHQGYINKLNKLQATAKDDYKFDVIGLIKNIDTVDTSIRDDVLYNAMAVANHNLYWHSMSSEHILPTFQLQKQILKQYNSYAKFVNEFIRVSTLLVGSGYTYLVTDADHNLLIMNLSNQDSPYVYGYTPLLALDLWEHSYYLDYLNNRNIYIDNFFKIVDFKYANEIYNKTQNK